LIVEEAYFLGVAGNLLFVVYTLNAPNSMSRYVLSFFVDVRTDPKIPLICITFKYQTKYAILFFFFLKYKGMKILSP
jgi:hypothetical protein